MILRKDLLERSRDDLPTMLDYRTYSKMVRVPTPHQCLQFIS